MCPACLGKVRSSSRCRLPGITGGWLSWQGRARLPAVPATAAQLSANPRPLQTQCHSQATQGQGSLRREPRQEDKLQFPDSYPDAYGQTGEPSWPQEPVLLQTQTLHAGLPKTASSLHSAGEPSLSLFQTEARKQKLSLLAETLLLIAHEFHKRTQKVHSKHLKPRYVIAFKIRPSYNL